MFFHCILQIRIINCNAGLANLIRELSNNFCYIKDINLIASFRSLPWAFISPVSEKIYRDQSRVKRRYQIVKRPFTMDTI